MNHKPLLAYMLERHTIYLRRLAGEPAPWTEDGILQAFKFCNVYRELDRTTIWIRQNIREPYADHPDLWYMLAAARFINHPACLQELIDSGQGWPGNASFTPEYMTRCLEARRARGDQMEGGAYMIRAESDVNHPWFSWSKQRYISEGVLGQMWEHRKWWRGFLDYAPKQRTLQETWGRFRQHRCLGPFMTYEVVTDMRHTRYLRNAPDIMTWANAGPGALRGLNRLAERPLKAAVKDPLGEMRTLLDLVSQNWPGLWPELELRDIEHGLCELDKYQRVLKKEGRPRSLFDWTQAGPLPGA